MYDTKMCLTYMYQDVYYPNVLHYFKFDNIVWDSVGNKSVFTL